MSKKVRSEVLFLSYIGCSPNFDQVKSILSNLDDHQYELLREIAINILEKVIVVKDEQFVKKNRKILSALADGKLLKKGLAKFSQTISEIARLTLLHNDLCVKYTTESQ